MVAWVGGVWVTNFIIKKGKKLNIVYIMNGLPIIFFMVRFTAHGDIYCFRKFDLISKNI